MKRKLRKIQSKGDKDLTRRQVKTGSQPIQASRLQTAPLHRNLADLPNQKTTLPLKQSTVLHMQRQYGNAYVQRYLAGRNGIGTRSLSSGSHPSRNVHGHSTTLQRQKQKGATKGESKSGSGNSKDWLSGKVYEVVKEELGEAKLKKHAESLADTAAKTLAEQIQGSRTEAEFLKKAQTKLLSHHLKIEIQKTVTELLKSPEGKKLRSKILEIVKTEPGVVL
ncbi:MAG TPA: hypothetical protein VFI27_07705 [candidate division Zixibacteria bacterium]|nr:hypothetical protein [candidate division Zixibacteria bacterium]